MSATPRARLRATAVIGIGLLLALAATLAPLPPAGGEPGASLAVRLPDAVRTVVLALFALSAILLLALRGARRPSEDEPPPSRAHWWRSRWMAALLAPLPLVLVVAAWYFIWNHWSGAEDHPLEQAFAAIAELLKFLALSRKPPSSVPIYTFTIATLVVLFALALLALMVLAVMAGRLEKWLSGRASADAAPALPDTLASHLDDPRAEPDPRRAIIRAWGRFEHALTVAQAPRAPWQTPTEFMHATLARLPLPAPPVRRLTALLEIARFSNRPLGQEARAAACESLDEITAALDENTARAR